MFRSLCVLMKYKSRVKAMKLVVMLVLVEWDLVVFYYIWVVRTLCLDTGKVVLEKGSSWSLCGARPLYQLLTSIKKMSSCFYG